MVAFARQFEPRAGEQPRKTENRARRANGVVVVARLESEQLNLELRLACGLADYDDASAVGADVLSQATVGQALHLLYDFIGSNRAVTDSAGQIVNDPIAGLQIYTFNAYGNAIGFTQSQALTRVQFHGEILDALTGKQNHRRRYYDLATGRFERVDPYFGNHTDPVSFNKYQFTHGNPISGTDPTGLLNKISVLGAAALAGTLTSLFAAGDAFGSGGTVRDIIVAAGGGFAIGLVLGPAALVPFLGPTLAAAGIGVGGYFTYDAYANENNLGLAIYRGTLTATGIGALGYARFRFLQSSRREAASLDEAGAFLVSQNRVGADLSSAAGRTVYRWVPSRHPAYSDAKSGRVSPFGPTRDASLSARAAIHDSGDSFGSGLTSWTVDRAWALSRLQRLGGVVLEATAPEESIFYNFTFKGAESQVLIPGNVSARVVAGGS